jgi:hypothetical protein
MLRAQFLGDFRGSRDIQIDDQFGLAGPVIFLTHKNQIVQFAPDSAESPFFPLASGDHCG